jgi:transcription elongation factor GreA-like protein
MNQEAIEELISGNPKLKNAREELAAMEPGSYCVHRSWGFGKIVDYDETEKRLVIDFEEGKKGHRMDPAFCIGKLEVLPAGHMLVQSREDPDSVDELVKRKPVELVIKILSESKSGTVSTIEIERQLSFLMEPAKARKWWTATKKLLIKDPRVAVPSKKTDPYELRDEPVTPEEEIMEEFYATQQSKQKILLAERLFALSNDKSELKKYLPDVLKTLTDAIIETRVLSQAERLHGVWVRNDLARDTHTDVESLLPTSASIILESEDDLIKLAESLPSAYYQRFLDLLTRVYPDRWEDIVIQLVRHSEGKFTNECTLFLFDQGKQELLVKSLDRWLNDQTIQGPILLWMLKNRTSRKYGDIINTFVGPRLLKAIFFAIDFESLQNASSRRIPLADAVIDDDALIQEILSDSDEETARDLAQTLMLNQGFEDLTKKSLLVRFIRIFPSIQGLVAEEHSSENKEGALMVSQSSLNEKKAEYEELISKKIPENKKASRWHGSMVTCAKMLNTKWPARTKRLLWPARLSWKQILPGCRVTDFADANTEEEVSIGSVVELTSSKKKLTVLTSWVHGTATLSPTSFPTRHRLLKS